MGVIYDALRHALINKWLLLSNPAEESEGVKGFLKICAAVLGPNDEAPVGTNIVNRLSRVKHSGYNGKETWGLYIQVGSVHRWVVSPVIVKVKKISV